MIDEIGVGQRRSRDVVCWQCGEKGHLQRDCPHKAADGEDDDIDDPNAYAGKRKQVIRISQPITVATRDNICHASARPPASQSTAPHFPSSLDRIRN